MLCKFYLSISTSKKDRMPMDYHNHKVGYKLFYDHRYDTKNYTRGLFSWTKVCVIFEDAIHQKVAE